MTNSCFRKHTQTLNALGYKTLYRKLFNVARKTQNASETELITQNMEVM